MQYNVSANLVTFVRYKKSKELQGHAGSILKIHYIMPSDLSCKYGMNITYVWFINNFVWKRNSLFLLSITTFRDSNNVNIYT